MGHLVLSAQNISQVAQQSTHKASDIEMRDVISERGTVEASLYIHMGSTRHLLTDAAYVLIDMQQNTDCF